MFSFIGWPHYCSICGHIMVATPTPKFLHILKLQDLAKAAIHIASIY